MSFAAIARKMIPTLSLKAAAPAVPAETLALRQAGRDQLQASVLKRINQHPERADELRALSQALGRLDLRGPGAPLVGDATMQGRLWMLPQLSPGQRTLLHDTRPGSPANAILDAARR